MKQTLAKLLGYPRLPEVHNFPHDLSSATFFITENCNSRCGSCTFWKQSRPWEEHLPLDRWKTALEELASVGVRRLRISGGEPFLYPHLFELCDHAAGHGFTTIGIQTNGLLLAKLHERINSSGITHLHVSLDGMEATNDALRGIQGHFDMVRRAIPLLGKTIHVATTPFKECIDEVEQLIDWCKDMGVATLGFNLPSTDLFYLKGAQVNLPSQGQADRFIRILGQHEDYLQQTRSELDFMHSYLVTGAIGYSACVLGLKKIFIGYSGQVFPACFPLGPVGNIRHDPLLGILSRPEYVQRLETMSALNCPGCVCGYHGNPKTKHPPRHFYAHAGADKKDHS